MNEFLINWSDTVRYTYTKHTAKDVVAAWDKQVVKSFDR